MPVVPGEAFVPAFDARQEIPQGQVIYNTIDKATPESFGGQVGQTLQQAADKQEQSALAYQHLINETSINDIYANQFSPAFRDLYGQFYQLRGKDAAAQFPAFQQQMLDLRNQVRDQLPNSMQQKMFDALSQRRINIELDGMQRHASEQVMAWNTETSNNILGAYVQNGIDKYNDPQQLQRNENSILVETAAYGAGGRNPDGTLDYGPTGAGQSAVAINMRAQHYIDQMYKGAIERQMITDPQAGIALYDQYKNKLSGPMQAELERVIKPVQELGQAQAAYGKVTGGATAAAIAQEAQRQGVDPGTALTIWSAEGGVTNPLTPNAKGSPALGIFQFMPDTWAGMGGTDRNRTDINRQIQLGIALTKQNSDALKEDLGRQPQPWEVYLAHQQGIDGATALIHADPNANAGDIVGNPKAISQNGGTPDMTVSRFTNYIKGYVDRHSMMYAANGVPTAQNLTENYETGLQAVSDLARQEHPGDPQTEERYRSHFIQQTGQALNAERVTQQANAGLINNALTGPGPLKSWQEFMSDPGRVDAYNSLFKTDRSIYDKVDKAITTNATSAWDPAASASTDRLYNQLYGMSVTDRDGFSKLDLMQYYGGMPVSQFKDLRNIQQKIQEKDPAEAARQTNMSASLTAISDVTDLGAVSPQSPYYKMDQASDQVFEQQKWNEFVGRFGQEIGDWRQNNGGKIPSVLQEREIAQQILFPQGTPAQHAQLGAEAASGSEIPGHGDTETLGRGAKTVSPSPSPPVSASVSSEGAKLTNPPPDHTNTGINMNADASMLVSDGKPHQVDRAERQTEGISRDADGMHIAGRDAPQEGNPWGTGAEGMPELWDFPKHPGVTRTDEEPSDAVAYYTPDRQKFLAPPQTDWSAVYEAGKANGLDPIAAWRALGYFGAFDFQRQKDKNLFISKYTDASNYAVGVYMRGAGFSLEETKFIAGLFAHTMSSNAGKPEQSTWWTNGWNAADSGEFAKQPDSMQDIE